MNMNDVPAPGRQAHNLFWRLHKALRACLCDTLMAVGSADSDDQGAVVNVLAQVRSMVLLCDGHMTQKSRHIHPAMEARSPGSTRASLHDHEQQQRAFAQIANLITQVEAASRAERGYALSALYQYLGRFVADCLAHMHAEEIHDQSVLSAAYGNAELAAIEARIVAGLTPQQRAIGLHWMLPAFTPRERISLLAAA
jgi:hypothetical protein